MESVGRKSNSVHFALNPDPSANMAGQSGFSGHGGEEQVLEENSKFKPWRRRRETTSLSFQRTVLIMYKRSRWKLWSPRFWKSRAAFYSIFSLSAIRKSFLNVNCIEIWLYRSFFLFCEVWIIISMYFFTMHRVDISVKVVFKC